MLTQFRSGVNLKGLGYELIIFLVAFIILILTWGVMEYGGSMAMNVLSGIATHTNTASRMGQMQQILYSSLFVLFILGIIFVWKSSKGGNNVQ